MGNGEWGMGNGEWGMGNGDWVREEINKGFLADLRDDLLVFMIIPSRVIGLLPVTSYQSQVPRKKSSIAVICSSEEKGKRDRASKKSGTRGTTLVA